MRLLNYLNFHLDSRKCIAAEVGAALVGAGASMVGTGASSATQSKSNHAGRVLARWQTEKNLELAHEQMAANRKMFEDSIAEQRLAEERANEWNKASAVAQRFRDAGINPYLAMMEGAAGQMVGQTNPSSAPSGSQGTSGSVAVSPSYPPVYDIGAGINEAVQLFYKGMQTTSDVTLNKIKVAKEVEDLQSQIELRHKQGLLTDKEAEWYERTIDEAKATFHERTRNLEASTDLILSQIKRESEEIESINIHDEIAKAASESNIKLNEAHIRELAALIKSHLATARNLDEDTRQKHLNGIVDRWAKRVGINQEKLRTKFLPKLLNKESIITSPYFFEQDYGRGYRFRGPLENFTDGHSNGRNTSRW